MQEEFPNAFLPDGTRRNLQELLEASNRGRTIMASQTFESLNAISSGETVADEAAVRAAVSQFLKAAGSYDVEAMPDMFAPNANIGAASLRDGVLRTSTYTVGEFLDLLRDRENPKPYDEPVSEFTVHVESGGLAFAAADATVYRAGQARSHNMDYFTLMKIDGEWKFLSASYLATPVAQ